MSKGTFKKEICLAGIVLSFVSLSFGATLDFTLNKGGLTSLTYGGTEMITNPVYGTIGSPTFFLFKKTDGSTNMDSLKPPSWSLDTANQTVKLTKANPRAEVRCKYVKVADTTIEFRIVIQNLSSDTLISAEIPLVSLASSGDAQILNIPCNMMDCSGNGPFTLSPSYYGDYPITSEPTSPYEKGPGATMIGLGNSCCVTLCNMNDVKKLIYWKLGTYSKTISAPKITVMLGKQINADKAAYEREVPSRCSNGQYPVVVDENFRVKPNSLSDTIVYQLRFTTPGLTNAKFAASARDIFMRYGGEYPFRWDTSRADRRPIMTVHFMNGENRGLWEGIPTVDGFGGIPYIADPEALETFHKRAMGYAQSWISKMRGDNNSRDMRGLIIWDLEGLFNKDTSGTRLYLGDPDKVDSISPEWGYKHNPGGMCLADTFFKTIKDAGFEPGLYVQPNTLVRVGNQWKQLGDCDGYPGEDELFKDVAYSYNRWGIKLFHLDDNGYHVPSDRWRRGGNVISADRVGKRILDAFPGVSFDAEIASNNLFRWGADYVEDPSLPAYPFINYIWPDAYSRLFLPYNTSLKTLEPISTDQIIGVLRHGDVIICNEDDNVLDSLDKIHRIVGNTWSRPTATITSVSRGTGLNATITIKANAVADNGFTLKRVEFLSAGIVLGADSTAPYEFQWTNALLGKHSLYARAVNNINKYACSPPVTITVNQSGSIDRVIQFINPVLKNNSGPMIVSIYSLNGRLIRKIDFKDPAHFVLAKAIKGLSSGIYVLKAKYANGTIIKRKIEAVW